MNKRKKHEPWGRALVATACFLALVILVSHLLFNLGILSPYERNGIDKISITCDGKEGEIFTQRYYGFDDFQVDSFKEFSDLPITQQLRCGSATVVFERRADLIDRFQATVMCGAEKIGDSTSDINEISCDKVITLEVFRI